MLRAEVVVILVIGAFGAGFFLSPLPEGQQCTIYAAEHSVEQPAVLPPPITVATSSILPSWDMAPEIEFEPAKAPAVEAKTPAATVEEEEPRPRRRFHRRRWRRR